VYSSEVSTFYHAYIKCLNCQDWDGLGHFVALDVQYNDQRIGLTGYRAILERNYREIPDLFFNITMLVCENFTIAARLSFDCRPVALFLGLPVNGRRVLFNEHVFYRGHKGKISEVWSIVDKAGLEAQLAIS
jgi:predicted ester cyclase